MKKRFGKREAAVSLCFVFSLILVVALLSGGTQRPAGTAGGGGVTPKDQNAPAKTPTDASPSEGGGQQASVATDVALDADASVPEAESQDADSVVLIDSGEQRESALEKQPFVMPEGMEYEPETALVTVSPSASAGEVNEALQAMGGVSFEPVTDEQIELGLIRVKLAEGVSIEDGVNQLLQADVVADAQPNYVYRTSDLLSSNEPQDSVPAQAGSGNQGSASSDGTGNKNATAGTKEEGASETPTEPATDVASGSASGSVGGTDEVVDAVDNAARGTAESKATSNDGAEEASENIVSAESGAETLSPDAELAAEENESAKVEAEASKETVNDDYVGEQWGLDSIHAREAWTLQKASGSVTVAVMDMGFYADAEDLKDNLLPGYNAFANSTNINQGLESDRKHGTHVAGTIGAITNNKLGVAGATYNAKVLPIMIAGKVNGEWIATSESFYRAFRYVLNNAASKNIRVINMSVGSAAMSVESWARSYVEQAYERNIVTVASAGNLGSSNGSAYEHYPSDIDECVAVMSLQKSGSGVVRASDSNYNRNAYDFKDICAPGINILSTVGTDKKYESMSGTSMATPFASSVLALEFAANPKLSAKDAVSILYGTATDLGASGWDVNYGWGEVNAYAAVNAAKNGLPASKLTEQANLSAKQERLRVDAAARSITYRTHVQTYGWQGWKSNGAMSGTSGQAKRLEAINIKLENAPYAGGITYRTHVQTYGWQGWKSNGAMSGTSGQAKRLEAIEIKLTGKMSEKYDVWYRVHAQSYGWLGWAKNGESAGTAGMAKRLEAIQIKVLPKGSAAPGSTAQPFVLAQIKYRTHVQTYGWQGYAFNGLTSGTTGLAKRLEGIDISLMNSAYSGGITYRTHVQTYGWQGWRSNGAMSGTSGQAKRLEAIEIKLTGTMAQKYDVWYRVHAQTFGWMGWAKNGERSGTAGMAKRLEAIQIVLLPKDSAAPGATSGAFRSR